MTGEMGCEQVRELAPELALGIAAGEDRDAALRHLSGCPACRQLVSELSSVGDELLLLAPEREPPAGFGSRVLTAIAAPPRQHGARAVPHGVRAGRRRVRAGPRAWLPRGRRWVAVAAAAVLAAAIGAGSVFVATSGDRELARGYRAVLNEGQGSTFAAAPLQGPQGRVGTVFGYQGHPSWMVVTVQPQTPDEGQLQVQALTRDGRYLALGKAVLGGGNRAWGGQIPVDLSAVRELRFVRSDGQTAFAATFGGVKSWN
jgi:anti-sigma factor RsiW